MDRVIGEPSNVIRFLRREVAEVREGAKWAKTTEEEQALLVDAFEAHGRRCDGSWLQNLISNVVQ
jgi:hypothetical protein